MDKSAEWINGYNDDHSHKNNDNKMQNSNKGISIL